MNSQPNKEKHSNTNRALELDGLRGIAVIIVLLSHYTWAYDYHFHILSDHFFHFPHGEVGVQLFFIISGFVIFMTIEASNSVKQFAINRFTRLYPTYWMSMLFTILFITLFPVPTLGEYGTMQTIVNFTMLQGLLKIPHIDPVYWTLEVELFFYIIISILFSTKLLKRIELISFFWLILLVLNLVIDYPLEKYLRKLLILDHAPLFIAGMMFYKLKFKESNIMTHLIILLSLFLYLISLYFQILERNQYEMTLLPFILVLIIYAIFYRYCYNEIKILRHRFLVFLGYISYPLYLLHNVIGYSLIYRFKIIFDNQLFYVVSTTIITVFMAFLMTKLMEKPSKSLKYYLTKKL